MSTKKPAYYTMKVLMIGNGFSKIYGLHYIAQKLNVAPAFLLLAVQEGFSVNGFYFDEAFEE